MFRVVTEGRRLLESIVCSLVVAHVDELHADFFPFAFNWNRSIKLGDSQLAGDPGWVGSRSKVIRPSFVTSTL